ARHRLDAALRRRGAPGRGPPGRPRPPARRVAAGELMAKAWEVHGLDGNARFREAAGRVVLTRWREMLSSREGTLLGEDIEELHAMRVSSRRLRAAMDAFAAAFPRKDFKRALRVVKEVTDTLGEAR